MRVLFVSGEASGDLYASRVMRVLKCLYPEAEIWAVGGEKSQEAGARILLDHRGWGAIGIFEALKRVPPLLLAFRKILRFLRRRRPDVLVLVDFGAFNRPLGRAAGKLGIKRIYYIPPGCWSRSEKPAKKALGTADLFITPFAWSAENLRKLGAKVVRVGHPLLEAVREARGGDFRRPPPNLESPTFAVLPGSREAELKHCLPVLLKACTEIARRKKGAKFVLSLAPGVEAERVRSAIPPGLKYRLFKGADEPLRCADVALVVSGTAVLQAALWRCPCLCLYRASPAVHLQYKLLFPKKLFISLPNLILGRKVVSELLQAEANPLRLALEALDLLHNEGRREEMLRAFAEIERLLEGPPPSETVAKAVLEQSRI